MEQELALRRGGVHLLGQRPECDPALLQLVYRREQMGQRSAETVKLPDHQAIARLKESEAFARPGRSPRLPLARSSNRCRSSTPRQQGIALQIHNLAVAVGRNAHVADEHVCGNPRLIGFRTHPIPTEFVVQVLALVSGAKPALRPPVGNHLFPVTAAYAWPYRRRRYPKVSAKSRAAIVLDLSAYATKMGGSLVPAL